MDEWMDGCTYIYTYTYIHTHRYIYIHVYMFTYIYILIAYTLIADALRLMPVSQWYFAMGAPTKISQ